MGDREQAMAGAGERVNGLGGAAGANRSLRTPLYHQIFLVLSQKIAEGTYGLNDVLPSEQELTRAYGVSRITAKRALDELAAAGLAVRERGRGTRVAVQKPRQPATAPVYGLFDNLFSMGLETDVRLLEFEYMAASDDVARALECAAGAPVQRAVRIRLLDGVPFSHLTTFVPEDVGRRFDRDDLASTALLALLERGGVRVAAAEQSITGTLADAAVAPQLETEIGAALTRVTRVVRDPDGRPVEYITALYRPDRYEVRMVLSRVYGNDENSWTPGPAPEPSPRP